MTTRPLSQRARLALDRQDPVDQHSGSSGSRTRVGKRSTAANSGPKHRGDRPDGELQALADGRAGRARTESGRGLGSSRSDRHPRPRIALAGFRPVLDQLELKRELLADQVGGAVAPPAGTRDGPRAVARSASWSERASERSDRIADDREPSRRRHPVDRRRRLPGGTSSIGDACRGDGRRVLCMVAARRRRQTSGREGGGDLKRPAATSTRTVRRSLVGGVDRSTRSSPSSGRRARRGRPARDERSIRPRTSRIAASGSRSGRQAEQARCGRSPRIRPISRVHELPGPTSRNTPMPSA